VLQVVADGGSGVLLVISVGDKQRETEAETVTETETETGTEQEGGESGKFASSSADPDQIVAFHARRHVRLGLGSSS
jgi:hypothetical protein